MVRHFCDRCGHEVRGGHAVKLEMVMNVPKGALEQSIDVLMRDPESHGLAYVLCADCHALLMRVLEGAHAEQLQGR